MQCMHVVFEGRSLSRCEFGVALPLPLTIRSFFLMLDIKREHQNSTFADTSSSRDFRPLSAGLYRAKLKTLCGKDVSIGWLPMAVSVRCKFTQPITHLIDPGWSRWSHFNHHKVLKIRVQLSSHLICYMH